MSSWTWVAKTLKNLKLATPVIAPASATQQSRLMSSDPREVSIPPKPKKPLTPYFRFIGQVRQQVKMENPDLKVTDLMKKVAEKWDKLDEENKNSYILAYKKEMAGFTPILEKYQLSLTPEQKEMQQQIKFEKQISKERREKRKRLKELGKPKRPPSGFLLFLMDKVPPGSSIVVHQEVAKIWTPKWKALSDAEKAPYNLKYKQELAKYQKEMSKWEEKMLKQGNEDLVRLNHLPKPTKEKAAKAS